MSPRRQGARRVIDPTAELVGPGGGQQHGDVPGPCGRRSVQPPRYHRPALGRRQPVHLRLGGVGGGGEEPTADVGRRGHGARDDRGAVAGRHARRLDTVKQRRTTARRYAPTTVTDLCAISCYSPVLIETNT